MDQGEIFDDIYRHDRWRGGPGTGSAEETTRRYARPGVAFRVLNAVTEPLPKLGSFRFALFTNGFPPGDEARTNADIPGR